MTNGNDPINSVSSELLDKCGSVDFDPFGLTKKEHFAAMSIGVAEAFLRDVSPLWILDYLGLPKGTHYEAAYYLQALAKIQCEMADNLINALNQP